VTRVAALSVYYAHLAPDYLHKAIDDHLPDF
jgi:hypothetical protein